MDSHDIVAPSYKRRKLSSTLAQATSQNSYAYFAQPMSPVTREFGDLEPDAALSGTPSVPHHTEEIHLQIHDRSVSTGEDDHAKARRRQLSSAVSAVTSEVTSVVSQVSPDDTAATTTTTNGNLNALSILESSIPDTTTVADTPVSVTSNGSPVESTTAVETLTDSTPTNTDTNADRPSFTRTGIGTGDQSSSAADSAGTTETSSSNAAVVAATASSMSSVSDYPMHSANISAGGEGTDRASGRTTDDTPPRTTASVSTSASTFNTRQTGSRASAGQGPLTSARQSNGTAAPSTSYPRLYFATLTNGDVVTVTRSDRPYTTTFRDGEVSLIRDLAGQTKPNPTASSNGSPITATGASQQGASSGVLPAGASNNAGQGASASAVAAGAGSTDAASSSNGSSNDTAPPGTIAGGVVGGAAGLAVIVLVALVLLKWYKRRSTIGHLALPASSATSPTTDDPSSRHPGMAERAGLRPLVGAVPAFLRHQNREQEASAGGERGFSKVSGRKLPSAFSAGMTSNDVRDRPPGMPLSNPSPEPNLNNTSFYRDSNGFYGGGADGSPFELADSPTPPAEGGNEQIMLSPGPQRTPTIRQGGPYLITPSSSHPNTPVYPRDAGTSPTFRTPPSRGDTISPFADNRSSRFTEEV